MHLVYIDNYDSFTYNSVDLLRRCGSEVAVFRNDRITLPKLIAMEPQALVIGPGPGRPDDAGISMKAIEYFYQKIPILGICLGHQCLGQFFGGSIVKAKKPSHGMSIDVYHGNQGIFENIPTPFKAALYNSLVVEGSALWVVARSDQEEVMGFKHPLYPLFGVQFHPESILSEYGQELLKNFVRFAIAIKHESGYIFPENADKV